MKRGLRILLVVVVIFVILSFAARKYLTSRRMAAQVASRLKALYGGPVRVAEVDIGLSSSSLTGVQLFEEDNPASQEPWVTVDAVKADVSFLSLLRGGLSPANVTLTGVGVTLRFDEEGHLLTQLPDRPAGEAAKEVTLPTLRIERGRVTLQKEGGAALVISGINATLESKGDQLVFSGAADDADGSGWGTWTMQGVFDRLTKKSSVTFKSDQTIHVTQALLNDMAFVPAKIWRAIQVEGDTPIAVTIRYDLADSAVHYRVELEPCETVVHVPAIDLDATAGRGKVVIDDGLVELRDVLGQAFEGTIRANADLDFRKAVTRLDFSKVEVQGLNMRRLPESWGLPRQIEGRLKGSAWLDVVLGNGTPQTRGEGQGEIVDAGIGGQPAAEPVHLELHAKEGGFGFRRRKPKVQQPADPDEEEIVARPLVSDLCLVQHAPPEETPLAARMVNDLFARLEQAVQGIARAGTRLVGSLPDKRTLSRLKSREAGRFVQVNLRMDRVDLALFVKGVGLELPFAVGGRLSFQVQASIPLDTSAELETYRVKGSAQVAQLRLADMELDEVRANVTYANGVLSLHDVTGRLSDLPDPSTEAVAGTFQGNTRLQLVPLGELTADMKLDRIPLSRVAVLAGAAGLVRGDFSGTIVARAPAARLQAVDAWEANAKITARQAQAFGWAVQDSAAEVRLKQGMLSLANLRVQVEGMPITGSAELRLADSYRYRGRFAMRDGDLFGLQRLAPSVRPPVPIAGRFDATVDMQGTLQPLSVNTTGTGTATDLKLYDAKLRSVAIGWESDNDQLTLNEVHARLDEGAVDGRAIIPLRPTVAGGVDLRMKELDLGALAKALPAMPFGVEGRAGGTLKGTFGPAAPGKERAVTVDLDLQAPRLRVQGIPTEQLQGTVGYHQGTVAYRFQGTTLGGRFELNGQMPAALSARETMEGRLRVERALLSRVNQIFHMEPDALPLRGFIDLEIKFRHLGPDHAPVGNGRVVVTRPRWGDTELTEILQGEVLLTRRELRLREITASVGGGLLRSQLALNLHRLEQSWFTLSLEGVDAGWVLRPWPSLAGKVEGLLEAHLRGRLGREWSGSGDLFLGRGKVLGVEVADWRVPLTWSFSPGDGRGEITFPESSAHAATGRAIGQATLLWGTGLRLQGHVRFFGLELRTLLRQATDSTQFGSGRVTGRFDFAGTDVRSVEDLTGTLEAELTQTQAFQFPVLRQVAPFLGMQTSSTFDRGQLRARLARGVIGVQNLSLQGAFLQLFVQGTVALAGRLDLDVTARPGANNREPARPRLLNLPIGLFHLRVTGTVSHPTIRVEPASLFAP